ncbi:AAA family ATPase [Paenibacillus sp. D9]|uniref:AAA family ATPase n=1 Tax=Paenibacillus sp. D9 TaxID=665792 RepID=UPI000AFB13ED|nr:AAA family ATPase [Paenibacillus sp. D9]
MNEPGERKAVHNGFRGCRIVWINGAFGSGKTQTAWELHRRLPGSYVFDPENAGYYIRANMPDSLQKGDFQEFPLWRRFNYDMLSYLADLHDGVLLVPMTVTDPLKFAEIAGRLRSDGRDLRHYALLASEGELLRRLRSRGEGRRSWAAAQIGRCVRELKQDAFAEQLDTEPWSVAETAERIAALAGLELLPRSGGASGAWSRLLTQLRHVRWQKGIGKK